MKFFHLDLEWAGESNVRQKSDGEFEVVFDCYPKAQITMCGDSILCTAALAKAIQSSGLSGILAYHQVRLIEGDQYFVAYSKKNLHEVPFYYIEVSKRILEDDFAMNLEHRFFIPFIVSEPALKLIEQFPSSLTAYEYEPGKNPSDPLFAKFMEDFRRELGQDKEST